MDSFWSCSHRSLRHAYLCRMGVAAVEATLTVVAFVVLGWWALPLYILAAIAMIRWRVPQLARDPVRHRAFVTLDRQFAVHVGHMPWYLRILALLLVPSWPVCFVRLAVLGLGELTLCPLHVRVTPGGRLIVYDDESLQRARESPNDGETARDGLLRSIAAVHDMPHDRGLLFTPCHPE